MHPSIEQLLNSRDGLPVAVETANHVAGCAACRTQVEQLEAMRQRLRSLPPPPLPATLSWAQVKARHDTPAATPPGRSAAVASTAAVLLAVLAWGLLRAFAPSSDQQRAVDDARLQDVETQPVELASLMDQSQELEGLLHALPRRPQVERAGTTATIATLEDRIQWLDYQLSYAGDAGLSDEQSRRLWSERVELMGSLVQVRYVEARYASF